MNSDIQKRWEKSGSYCTMTDNKGLASFKGTYYLEGVLFSFTVTEQASGAHILRGQVSIFSSKTGRMMKKPSQKDKNGKGEAISKSIYPTPASFTDKSTWMPAVMERVEKAALSLLSEYRHLIKRDVELAAVPGSISPQLALLLYGESFIRRRHGNAKEESAKDYLLMLSKVIRSLPNKPMAVFSEGDVKKALDGEAVSRQARKLTRDFWSYCLDSRYCDGSNPFPEAIKRRKTAKAKQAAADRLDVLDDSMQEALYQRLLLAPSGADCGIALMLWGGFEAKTVCSLNWGDLNVLGEDMVQVPLMIEDNAGATHNYTRLIAVQAARILKARYDGLKKGYGKTRLKKMPVVSLTSNLEKPLRRDDLNKYGLSLLQRLGISQDTIAASKTGNTAIAARVFLNSYARNLVQECGLGEDDGLFRFLRGQSLAGNMTADHYRSFTDPDGVELQYSVLRRMAPDEPIELGRHADRSHEDYDEYFFAPPTTRDLLSLSVELADLPPGSEVSILDRYGDDIRAELK